MKTSASHDILLESGTNELEVVLFEVGQSIFGINVLKVREIIKAVPVVKIPQSHPYVEGVMHLREEVLPVVNLAHVLDIPDSETPEDDKMIIAELNQHKIAFRVHHIRRIYRFSWKDIEKPDELSGGQRAYAIGYIKFEADTTILLDFEKILVDINPKLAGELDQLKALGPRERSEKKLIVAEDSAVLRELLKDTLTEAGYHDVLFFENGQDAWDYLKKKADNEAVMPTDDVHLIVTDIEMPQMDGHHLTTNVKHHPRLKDIPVVIFSSLITEDLYHKGERVGASAQIAKPEIVALVKKVDQYIL